MCNSRRPEKEEQRVRTSNPRTRQLQDALLLTRKAEGAMTRAMTSGSRGYTLVELLVSIGSAWCRRDQREVFQLINPSQATAQKSSRK